MNIRAKNMALTLRFGVKLGTWMTPQEQYQTCYIFCLLFLYLGAHGHSICGVIDENTNVWVSYLVYGEPNILKMAPSAGSITGAKQYQDNLSSLLP